METMKLFEILAPLYRNTVQGMKSMHDTQVMATNVGDQATTKAKRYISN
jgi:hypothetical protein